MKHLQTKEATNIQLNGEQDPFAHRFPYLYFVLFALAYILLIIFGLHLPFFDDTIIFSQQARYFYNQDFWQFQLPASHYTGNPELFPLYLSWLWKLFGKSLVISHLAMVPLVLMLCWQIFLFVRRFIPEKYMLPALILLFIEPTLQAQSLLFSKSVMISAFFLMGINQIFQRNNYWMGFALAGLILTDLTGMVLIIAVLLSDILISKYIMENRQSLNNKTLRPYLFVSFLLIAWILYCKFVAERTPYAFPDLHSSHNFSSFGQILSNDLRFDLRLIDYGRAGYWIFLLIFLGRWVVGKESFKPPIKILIILSVVTIGILELSMVFYDISIKTRYLLPAFILLPILFIAIMAYGNKPFIISRRLALSLVAIILASGHVWIFPNAHARDWDASHGWIPWVKLAKERVVETPNKKEAPGAVLPYNFNKAAFLNEQYANYKAFTLREPTEHVLLYNVMRNYHQNLKKLQSKGWKIEKRYNHLWTEAVLLHKPLQE